MNEHCLIYVTFPNHEEAEKIARQLVEQRLAACVNIIPDLSSIYRWQEKICCEKEVVTLIKTRSQLFPAIEQFISTNHSYDTCCVLKIPLDAGNNAFLRWIDKETRPS